MKCPVWSLLLPLVLTACTVPGDAPGEPVTATIGPAGGTIEATDASGATLRLTLPEGALEETVELTVVPVDAQGDEVARFTILPAGGLFAREGTATLTADGLETTTALVWTDGDVRTLLPTEASPASVSAPIQSFGYPGVGTGAALRTVADGDGTTLTAEPMGCAEALDFEASFHAAGRQPGNPTFVSQQWTTTEGVVQACASGGDAQVAELERRVCARYAAEVIDTRAFAADSFEQFQEIVEPLLAARGDVEIAGATCEEPEYETVLGEKFSQLLAFFDARLAPDQLSDDLEAETDLLEELFVYDNVCQLGGLSACGPLTETLYPAVADKLRAAAYLDCQTRGTPRKLGELFTETLQLSRPIAGRLAPRGRRDKWLGHARFTYGDIEEDVAYCASSLELFVFDADAPPGEVLPRPAPLAGGPAPGSGENEATVELVRGGSLTVGGEVLTLPCPDGSTPDDALVVRVGGVQVATAAGAGRIFTIATQPLVLTTDALLAAAGAEATSWNIDLFREGSACGAYTEPFKLYTIHATLPEPAPVDPCQPAADSGGLQPDQTNFTTLAEGAARLDGVNIAQDTDFGTGTASVSRTETDFSYTASASAARNRVSVSTDDSGSTDLRVSSLGEAKALQSVGILSGRGEGHVSVRVTLDGTLASNNDSAGFFTVEFDPDDDIGASESASFTRGGGLGGQTVHEVLTIEHDFSFNLGAPTRAYLSLYLQQSDGGDLEARVTSVQITTVACTP